MLKARLQPLTGAEQRTSRRRIVSMGAQLRGAATDPSEVRVLDLSEHGCRITPADRLGEGDRAHLKLAGMEGIGCTVTWTDGCDAGLEFDRRLHQADVEAAKTVQVPAVTRRAVFGQKQVVQRRV